MAAVHNMLAASGDGYVTVELALAANVNNYVLNTAKVVGYIPGATRVVLTINPGVVVGSASTGSPALTIDTSWAARDKVEVINNGRIAGAGGVGGNAVVGNSGTVESSYAYNTPGGDGGVALAASRSASFTNSGVIAGGGGGGGSRASVSITSGGDGPPLAFGSVAAGGGGAGVNPGARGEASDYTGSAFYAAQPGTSFSGGAPGTDPTSGNSGGRGGDPGQPGQAAASAGGSGGPAVTGNSNITWVATGTRLGAIA